MSLKLFLPDIIVIGIILIYGCKGLGYGFSRSLASLIRTFLSLSGAVIFSVDMADLIRGRFPGFPSPQLFSYLFLFTVIFILFKIIFYNIFRYKRDDSVGTTSRLLAFPIGLIEGILILFFIAGLFVFQDLFEFTGSFWHRSIILRFDTEFIPLFRSY